MLRLILIIAILVLVLSAFFLPRFRKALGLTVLGVVSVIILIIWLDNRERELARISFPLEQVELQNMQAQPGLNSRSYVIKGRVRNHSPETPLRQVIFEVRLRDCDGDRCEIVAQERGRVSMVIPPTQSRDFQVSIPFSTSINLQGTADWSFEVLAVNDR